LPEEVQALLRSRAARDPAVADSEFSSAFRGEAESARQILAGALTSQDDNQAAEAGWAIMRLYGCEGVPGEVREQALRQMQTFPTPYGALLLSCLDQEKAAIDALKSFEPIADLRWFGSLFRDWETLRTFTLAEAGQPEAKQGIVRRINSGDLAVLVPLLMSNHFSYIRDRDILIALTASLLDDRLMRPGEPTDTDHVNPLISDLALGAFDFRFRLGVHGDRVPSGGYTTAHKREAYERARALLMSFEEGERIPQRRLPERISNGD
jgi:hypothetical protein